jgi:hypothetical protein
MLVYVWYTYRQDGQWWKESNVRLGIRERERGGSMETEVEGKRVSNKLETSWNEF